MKLLGGILVSLRPSVRPSVRPCQFAADDILLYEFCYYNPMDLLYHLEKGKEELSPLQYHIKSLHISLHIISRHYKKSLLRSQIYHGYEELSTDTNYHIWRRQERRSKYVVQLASWQLKSNSPKASVRPSVCPSVRPASRVCSVVSAVLVGAFSYSYVLSSNFRRCVMCKISCKISKSLVWVIMGGGGYLRMQAF